MLLSGRLSVISDQSAMLQMSNVDRWCLPRPHKWRGPPNSTCIRARGRGPRHAPGWSAVVHGSGGHRAITL